jgi:DNA-directed RNA polymerase specialized sigma24 family protein
VAALGSGLFTDEKLSNHATHDPDDVTLRRIIGRLHAQGVELTPGLVHQWALIVQFWPSVEGLTDLHRHQAVDLAAHGWAVSEIAELLGCPPVCVSNAVSGARSSLP